MDTSSCGRAHEEFLIKETLGILIAIAATTLASSAPASAGHGPFSTRYRVNL
jgi:hypothetical protein